MTTADDKYVPESTPKQRDLFGMVDKRQQQVDKLIARNNKADNAAGLKPFLQPLFPDDNNDTSSWTIYAPISHSSDLCLTRPLVRKGIAFRR